MKRRIIFCGLVLLAPLTMIGYGLHKTHNTLVRERQLLPLDFNHQVHGTINCVKCHHNYVDRSPAPATGERSCLLCHKRTSELALTIERDFHQLCRGCHIEQAKLAHNTGPLRECSRCHAIPITGRPSGQL